MERTQQIERMDAALSARIDRWIEAHREALVADTCRLVRIMSVADEEKAQPGAPFGPGCRSALDAYLDIARAHGLAVRDRDGYVGEAYVPEWAGKPRHIGLMGHLDVVPADGGWQYPPYGGVVDGDLIIGRGAQDNKGPCMAALYAVLCLRDLGIALEDDVLALAGTDEEMGMKDAEHYARMQGIPDLILVTDSGFPICYGERGIVSGTLTARRPLSSRFIDLRAGTAGNVIPDYAEAVLRRDDALMAALAEGLPQDCGWREEDGHLVVFARGVGGHLAFSTGMRSAIGALLNALLACGLAETAEDRALLGFAAAAAGSRDGDALGIACEDEASGRMVFGCGRIGLEDGRIGLSFSARGPVSADCARVGAALTRAAEAAGFGVQGLRMLNANYFPRETPVVQTLSAVFQRETGLSWPPQVFAAGTHARKLPNAVAFGPGGLNGNCAGVPAVAMPEGHGGAHQPDEAQSIAALCKALKIYISGVIALDGKPLSKNDRVDAKEAE